jgi:hypothetical protein
MFATSAIGEPESQSTLQSQTELILPITEIFDQTSSRWCWAHSTRLTLTTYFSQHPAPEGWDAAKAMLTDQQTFHNFMSQRFAWRERHFPKVFIDTISEEFGLPLTEWSAVFKNPRCNVSVPSEVNEGESLPQSEVVGSIVNSLEQGSPAVHCNGVHCVTIFGVRFRSGIPYEFIVADSMGARRKTYSTAYATENFCSMLLMR